MTNALRRGRRNGFPSRRLSGRSKLLPRPAVRAAALFVHLIVLLSAVGPLAAQDGAREEILAYDVRVDVGDGGALRVTEEIRIRALGEEIRRGIFRDFPTRFPREWGIGTVVAPFRVLSVSRNGAPEPYRLESVAGPAGRSGVRIRVGNENVLLDRGVHDYRIVYETARWWRFGDDRDRLEWNVTGTGWSFPILRASAEVALPATPPPGAVELAAWTGPEGSTAQDADWTWDAAEGVARFRTTEALGSREGLTVRVDVPAGVVLPPTEAQEARWFRLDWGGFVDAGLVVALVIALYLLLWFRVGRDPASGAIVVRYEPPEGFSPAGLGYLRERGFEPAQLAAALVSLAVKGAVTIERDNGSGWTIRTTGTLPDDLSKGERALHEQALSGRGVLSLKGESSSRLRKGVKALRMRLERELEKSYFVLNRGWFAAGVLLSIAGFAALVWRYRFSVPADVWFLGVWLTFWTMGVSTLVVRVVRLWSRTVAGDLLVGFGAVFMTLFALPFVTAEVVVAGMLYARMPHHVLAAAVALGVMNVAFYHLLERPTLKGRGVLDRLEGFRRFLGATEEDRMDRLQPPDASLELFERYLPHAIALGVENEWADRFGGVLAAGSRAPDAGGGVMAWYSAADGGVDLAGMTSSLGGSLSSTLSSSSAPPSSSGGGGGGGSSGGGGGGGGGGGW